MTYYARHEFLNTNPATQQVEPYEVHQPVSSGYDGYNSVGDSGYQTEHRSFSNFLGDPDEYDEIGQTPDPVRDEGGYRDTHARFGRLDFAAGLAAASVALAGEYLQTEHQADPSIDTHSAGSLDRAVFDFLANTHLDWKGVMVAAGTFVAVNAFNRVYRGVRYPVVAQQAVETINGGSHFIPNTPEQMKRNRLMHRVGRGVVTLAACYGAYKLGEQGTVAEDGIATGGLIAGSYIAVKAVELATKLQLKASSRFGRNQA